VIVTFKSASTNIAMKTDTQKYREEKTNL